MSASAQGDFAQPLAGLVQQQTVNIKSDVNVSGGVMTGDVVWSAAATRSGSVLCDGSTYDGTTATYLALWTAIGVTYGGSGQSAFKVPDLRSRVAVGAGTNVALAANDGVSETNRVGTRHRHTAHTHTIPYNTGGQTSGSGGANVDNAHSTTATSSVDGGSSHSSDPLDGPAFLGLNAFVIL